MTQVTSSPTFDVAFSRDSLADVWSRLKASKTDPLTSRVRIPAGWDGVSLRKFERQLSEHLAAIERQVRTGRYTFRPFVHHFVPKVDGGERKIAYSGIRDRIVQAALHDILGPAVNARLTDSAFAYRQGVSTHDAVRKIHSCATGGQPFFVKSDFVQFFDRLSHDRLKNLIDGLEIDRRARELAWRFVRTGDVPRDGNRESKVVPPSRTVGVPQGGVVSGLLANLYLGDFDESVRAVEGSTLIRYADDFLVMCRDEHTCINAFRAVVEGAQAVQLDLHDGDKTVQCGHINDGVHFVGFRLRGSKVAVKPSNVAKFKKRIHALVELHERRFRRGEYSSADECLRQTVRHVNLKLTGVEVEGQPRSWIVCFRILNDVEQVRQLDRWVWKRIASLSQRVGLPYRTRTAVFALGYRGLLREYWGSRRRLGAVDLVFTGMVARGAIDVSSSIPASSPG